MHRPAASDQPACTLVSFDIYATPLRRLDSGGQGLAPRHLSAALGLMLVVSALLSGCAAPVSDRVVLLPGRDGRPIGGVTVRTAQGERLLDKPYAEAIIRRDGAVEIAEAKAEDLRTRHQELLQVQPPKPRSWTIYFISGADQLTPESEAVLTEVRDALAAFPGGELVLTGHTDRVGTLEDNDRLSLQRAAGLKDRLAQAGFAAGSMQVAGRGEREPLVATPDETAEPRNRRVEIKLR